MTQEEMAVRLNIVRQTVSKYENNLSVPDADILVQIAELLGVTTEELLGVTPKETEINLAEELAIVNGELAKRIQKEKIIQKANKKRGFILELSFAGMLSALLIDNEIVSVVLTGICLLSAVIILYRNLALLTSNKADKKGMNALKLTVIFNVCVLVAVMVYALLFGSTTDSIESGKTPPDKVFAAAIVSAVMIFSGIISPRLPHSRHIGLRLPWTVSDEYSWKVAHNVLGIISIPLAFLYVACAFTVRDLETVTLVAMILWIGIPAVISLAAYLKNIKGRE